MKYSYPLIVYKKYSIRFWISVQDNKTEKKIIHHHVFIIIYD